MRRFETSASVLFLQGRIVSSRHVGNTWTLELAPARVVVGDRAVSSPRLLLVGAAKELTRVPPPRKKPRVSGT
jgi:hypothetical protein